MSGSRLQGIPQRPPPFLTPTLDRALRQLQLTVYRYSTPDPKGQQRRFIDFARFDPSPIRGRHPPSDNDTTLIPLGIGIRYWVWEQKLYEWTVKHSYQWIAVTWTQLLQLHHQVAPEERCFFAVCLDEHPCSLFLDLDCDGALDEVQTAQEMNRLLRLFFKHSLRRDIHVSSMVWAGSSSPEKTSLHGHYPAVSFRDTAIMKQVMAQFRDFVVTQETNIKPEWIDDIYTKNRNFRCLLSRKPGKIELRPLHASQHSTAELLWTSLPSYCVQPGSLIPVDRCVKIVDKGKKSAKRQRAPSPPPPSLKLYFTVREKLPTKIAETAGKVTKT